MKLVDLFCGAGGMGLGFEQAGFDIVYALDFDKYAVQSYNENMKTKAIQSDITETKGSDIPQADVWTFGFPCQDLSVAGKKAGMIKGKTRSGLFYEVMRLLDEVEQKPKMILAENVKGLKKYLPELEEEYERAGYTMQKEMFNSKYWGVPQNRERYFVIGVRKDIGKSFEYPTEQHDFVPKLSSILETDVDEKYYIDNEKAKKIIEQAMKRVDLKGNHATLTVNRTEKRQNGRRAKEDEESIFTLSTQDQHGITVKVKNQANKITGKTEVSGTLLARDYKGFGNQEMDAVVEGFRVRKLTPREYARLQGFGDDWKFVCSNTQLYKQFGNAVTVNVSYAIAKKMGEFLNETI